MSKFDFNGIVREMTEEEKSSIEKENRIVRYKESTRPLSAEEVISMFIAAQINTLSVDDNTALRMKRFYPTFSSVVGQEVENGYRFIHNGRLWTTTKKMVLQSHYPPGPGMESLFAEVCETHSGTMDDPIPYNDNMVLKSNKYYIQNDVIYLCNRDTVTAVYHPLHELAGVYVTEV